ncbi:MAG: LPXTG cell wall anchor domain-containing protein [Promicromonosporaceae bacterium]|nr:LPXTG cell wall anchor domain-containing protein [Promicromonosporaceae bacterium]
MPNLPARNRLRLTAGLGVVALATTLMAPASALLTEPDATAVPAIALGFAPAIAAEGEVAADAPAALAPATNPALEHPLGNAAETPSEADPVAPQVSTGSRPAAQELPALAGNGEVSGRVLPADHLEPSPILPISAALGVPEVGLLLFENQDGQPGDLVARTITDHLGEFRFADVPAGEYIVSVDLELPGENYFWREYEDASAEVTLEDGVVVGEVGLTMPSLHREPMERTTPTQPFNANPLHGLAVDLDPAHLSCPEGGTTCEATWYSHVYNHGQTPLTNTVFYSVISESVTDVRVYGMGRVPWGMVAAGFTHSMALDLEGRLWAWGSANNGRLGDGTSTGTTGNTHARAPQRVIGPAGSGTWANCRDNGIGCLEDVIYVAAGGTSVAMTEDGRVYAWGLGGAGRIGDGATSDRNRPTRVTTTMAGNSPLGSAASGANSRIVAIAAGDTVDGEAGWSHALAVDSEGHVWGWGHGNHGQMGRGNTTATNSRAQRAHRGAQPLTESNGAYLGNIVDVASALGASMALDANGYVWAWGNNGSGRLGDGTTTQRTTPVRVLSGAQGPHSFLDNIIDITAGPNFSLALDSAGTVWAWGNNANGRLGDGTTTNRSTPVQVQFPAALGEATIIQVSAGDMHSLALDSAGRVWAWGNQALGRLGNGVTTGSASVPLLVDQTLMGSNIVDVGAGANHSLATTIDGYVWAWGRGDLGQMGEGPPGTADRSLPVMTRPHISDWTRLLASSVGQVIPGEGAEHGAQTVRSYPLAATIAPGTTRTTRLVATLPRTPGIDEVVTHQIWATNHNNPLPGGISAPLPAVTPAQPIDWYGIPGNPTCNTNTTGNLTQHGRRPRPEWPRPDSHGFPTEAWPNGTWDSPLPAQWLYAEEDQCDQVPVLVPATPIPLGTLEGVVWQDLNGDGLRQPGEPWLTGVTITVTSNTWPHLPPQTFVIGDTLASGHSFRIPGVPAGSVDVHFDLGGANTPDDVALVFTAQSVLPYYASRYDSDADAQGWVRDVTIREDQTTFVDAGAVPLRMGLTAVLTSPSPGGVGDGQWVDPAHLPNPIPVTLTITNTGNEPLLLDAWQADLIDGPAIAWGSCSVTPAVGGGGGAAPLAADPAPLAAGTVPPGPLAPGEAWVCQGTVAMGTSRYHRTEVTAHGRGAVTDRLLTADDYWWVVVDDFVPFVLPTTGGAGTVWLVASMASALTVAAAWAFVTRRQPLARRA